MYDDGDAAMVDELASHPHVRQILDLLSESGCHAAFLARIMPIRHTDLISALHLIAAYGLLTTDNPGSWDDPLAKPGRLRLTDRGEAVANKLSNSPATRVLQVAHPPETRHRFRRQQ